MPREPYIGIVGVKSAEEAMSAAGSIDRTLKNCNVAHRGQIGVQVTTRTLRGEKTESKRNPAVADIPDIFRAALATRDDIFPVVHFTTREYRKIFDLVCQIFDIDGMYEENICRGLQLNGQFGNLKQGAMESVRLRFPNLKIIMQLHSTALHTMSQDVIVMNLKSYDGCIDYVLIDPSGGRGEELVPVSCSALAWRLKEQMDVGVAFAGGFNKGNVSRLVSELADQFGSADFSIDFESGIRDRVGPGYGNDLFNPKKAHDTFCGAAQAFAKFNKTAQ